MRQLKAFKAATWGLQPLEIGYIRALKLRGCGLLVRVNCMQFKYYLEKQIKVLALKFSNSQIYQPKAALSLSTVIHFDLANGSTGGAPVGEG